MRKNLFLFSPLVLGLWIMMILDKNENPTVTRRSISVSEVVSCAPGADDVVYTDASGKFIRLLPGWGDHAYRITTANDSAQVYFNQGLTMYFSYHSREAIASFREAARFDSTCAMAYWGQAIAMGPSFNFYYLYKQNVALPTVLEKMNRYAAAASEKEKGLIAALNNRYDLQDTANKKRKELNAAYVSAMKQLLTSHPDDLDIKAIYVDAVMLSHPWEFWFNDGSPKPWTPEIVSYCEEILSKDPHHPGALHYYIHVTEASRQPEVALPSADSLIKLYPGIAHMVHMSSHEYERTGYYPKGVSANEKADESAILYDSLAKGLYPQVHVPHYYAVDAYCALSGNMHKKGIEKGIALRKLGKPNKDQLYPQYGYMYLQLARVRMGMWQEILADATGFPKDWTFAVVLDEFAKGMASARIGRYDEARTHLAFLRANMKDEALKEKFAPHASSPYEVATVAAHLLEANILFEEKKHDQAIRAVNKAIRAEDRLIYSEPKMWMMPSRQYLGAFYMELNKPKKAEKVYREDLEWNPGNGWSLLGLHQALSAQGINNDETRRLKELFMQSFAEAENLPARSAY